MALRAVWPIMVQGQKIAKKSASKPNPRDSSLSRVCEYRRHTPGEAIVHRAETGGAMAGRGARKPAGGPGGVPSLGHGVDSNKTDYLEAPARASVGGEAAGGERLTLGDRCPRWCPIPEFVSRPERQSQIRRAGQEGGKSGLCSSFLGGMGPLLILVGTLFQASTL